MNSVMKVGPSFNGRFDGTLCVIENGKRVRKIIDIETLSDADEYIKKLAKDVAPDSELVHGQPVTEALTKFINYIEKLLGFEIPNKDQVFAGFWQDPQKGFQLTNLPLYKEGIELNGSYLEEALDVEVLGADTSGRHF